MLTLTNAMTAYLKQYRTPIFIDHGNHGEEWGSGTFIELDGQKYILTNEHVARARNSQRLGFRFDEQENMPRVIGKHIEQELPWDLALLPVTDEVWSMRDHRSALIQEVNRPGIAGGPISLEDWGMMTKTTTKFSLEVRERAVRMVQDHAADYPSRWAAVVSIAEKIGCVPQTLYEWVRKAEVDSGKRAGVPTEMADRLKALERENRELRQANEILRKASAYFAQAELDRPFKR